MTDATPYIVPQEPGLGRSLALAAMVHAALIAFLWIGVQWQSATPIAIEAEVWSPLPREAAPLPEPVKTPEPRPEPPAVEPPKPKVVEPPPLPKPDIALEQEKKRKAEEKKRREDEEKLAKEKEKKRLEEEKLAKLELEKKKQQEKEKADKAKKDAAEKQRKQDEEMLAKLREQEMRRVTGGVTGTGGTGDAAKAQGGRASAEYGTKIAARIKSHTVFPASPDANQPVEYMVELLPDGTLRSVPRKLKSSGIPSFDEAVLRAIDKSQPFPRDDKTGAVPSSITISHRPKDQ